MSKFTIVYSDFIARLDEVTLLRRKAGTLERSSISLQHGPEIRALCRGAVVLLSSHIEAYIKELGEHTLDTIQVKSVCRSTISPQFFYYLSKSKIDGVKQASKPEKVVEHLRGFMESESAAWAPIGGFTTPISSDDFIRGFSNPKFDKVKGFLSRFGYDGFKSDFMRKEGANGMVLVSKLDQIVNTRNSIAHGDPAATKTPTEVAEMEKTARRFCMTVDMVFAAWCRSKLCSIR